jgi:uncharacterized membrane protein YqjE
MESLSRLLRSALALLLTRAEFASVELSLARAQLMRWLLFALVAAVFAMLGLIAASAFIVFVLWDRFGWVPVGALAVLYGGAALWLVLRVVQEIGAAPPLLEQTFAELARDRDAIFSTAHAARAADADHEP